MKQTAPRRFGEESDTTYRSLCKSQSSDIGCYKSPYVTCGGCSQGGHDRSAGKCSHLGYILKAEKAGLTAGGYGGNGKRRLKLGFKMFYLIR